MENKNDAVDVTIYTKDNRFQAVDEGQLPGVQKDRVTLKLTFDDAITLAFLTLRLSMEHSERRDNAMDGLRQARRIYRASK